MLAPGRPRGFNAGGEPGAGLLLLIPEVVTVSLLAPEVAMDSLLAESTPEAAAVGPRGDQAVVGGGGYSSSP